MSKVSQIIFLIDIRCIVREDGTKSKIKTIHDQSALISLATLKVLTYYFYHNDRPRGSLKWDYQFCDSSDPSHNKKERRRKDFKEFCTDEIEAFENALGARLEKHFLWAKSKQCAKNSLEEENSCPVDKLNLAIKDVLLDYQWDKPDLTSPVRSKSKRKRPTHKRETVLSDDRDNILFVVSHYPHTKNELKAFFGSTRQKLIESCNARTVFTDLMSDNIFSGFLRTHKINLCFIDTNTVPSEKNFTDTMECKQSGDLGFCGGYTIPLGSLAFSTFPLSSILPWYLKKSKYDDISYPIIKLSYKDDEENFSTICFLQLVPFSKSSSKSNASNRIEAMGKNQNDCLIILGATSKFFIGSNQNASYAAFPSGNINFCVDLFENLQHNNIALIISWKGYFGLFYPISSLCAIVHCFIVPIKSLAELDDNFKKGNKLEWKPDNDFCSAVSQLAETSLQDFEESHLIQKDSAINEFNASLPFHVEVLENWFVPQTSSINIILKDCLCPDETEDVSLLKQLQELYKTDENDEHVVIEAEDHEDDLGNEEPSQVVENQLSTSEAKELVDSIDYTDENKMFQLLKLYYQETVEGERSLLSCAENIVNIVYKYVESSSDSELKEVMAIPLLEKNMFKSLMSIAQFYENLNSETHKTCRVRDYELQVLLRLVILNLSSAADLCANYVDEIAEFLRMLVIYLEPLYVIGFLQDARTQWFPKISEDLLRVIYDELHIPLPKDLKNKDDFSADGYSSDENSSSLKSNVTIASSSTQILSVDPHQRSRLPRPSSFNDLRNKRQIVVEKLKRKIPFDNPSTNKSSGVLDSKADSYSDGNSNAKKVCRNLFNFGKTLHSKDEANESKERKRHVLKTKSVTDTPLNKQVASAFLHRQARQRDRSIQYEDNIVVEETPEKSSSAHNLKDVSGQFESPKIAGSISECAESQTVVFLPQTNIFNLRTPVKACSKDESSSKFGAAHSWDIDKVQIRRLLKRSNTWPPRITRCCDTFGEHIFDFSNGSASELNCSRLRRFASEQLHNRLPCLCKKDFNDLNQLLSNSSENIPSTPLELGEVSPSPISLERLFDLDNDHVGDEMDCSSHLNHSPNQENYFPETSDESNSSSGSMNLNIGTDSGDLSEHSELLKSPEIKRLDLTWKGSRSNLKSENKMLDDFSECSSSLQDSERTGESKNPRELNPKSPECFPKHLKQSNGKTRSLLNNEASKLDAENNCFMHAKTEDGLNLIENATAFVDWNETQNKITEVSDPTNDQKTERFENEIPLIVEPICGNSSKIFNDLTACGMSTECTNGNTKSINDESEMDCSKIQNGSSKASKLFDFDPTMPSMQLSLVENSEKLKLHSPESKSNTKKEKFRLSNKAVIPTMKLETAVRLDSADAARRLDEVISSSVICANVETDSLQFSTGDGSECRKKFLLSESSKVKMSKATESVQSPTDFSIDRSKQPKDLTGFFESDFIIPRFTRNMSHEMRLTPDVFNTLCCFSPDKQAKRQRAKDLVRDKDDASLSQFESTSSSSSSEENSITHPPDSSFSPTFASPTASSLVHLTSSPVLCLPKKRLHGVCRQKRK